jgi:aminopeptidase N
MLRYEPKGIAEGFELPGSTAHYPPTLLFTVDYMSLTIRPDLKSESNNLINCIQKLDITARQTLDVIELDIAEIKVDEVLSSPNLCQNNTNSYGETVTRKDYGNSQKRLKFNDKDKPDKLTINLYETLLEGKSTCIIIKYSAGVYHKDRNERRAPRSGFHFIKPDQYYPKKDFQAWTQGETLESRYWFPCLDDPQLKFPREVHVIVPEEFTVVSNGKLESKNIINYVSKNKTTKQEEGNQDRGERRKSVNSNNNNYRDERMLEWVWKEVNPNPAYLTCVVIGKFRERKEVYHGTNISNYDNDINKSNDLPLYYYWTVDTEERGFDPLLTFGNTQEYMVFFEEYLRTKFPYSKYAQSAVEDFDFGGMENTSCTVLTKNILHDRKALPDYTRDMETVRHELAHQWFGDLVTCRDWQHIWLNEGFASYFEALYLDRKHIRDPKSFPRNTDQFLYYMIIRNADVYMSEAISEYKRPIVTNIYKHPDDLFDSHSYRKGACVLHMLRNDIGENDFRESLRVYLERYKNRSAETEDFRRVCEEVSGKSLQKFFNQWLYTPGHPMLIVELFFKKRSPSSAAKPKEEKEKQEQPSPIVIEVTIKQIKEKTKEDEEKEQEEVQLGQAKEKGKRYLKVNKEDQSFEFPLDIKLYFTANSNDNKGQTPKTYTFNISKNEETFSIDIDSTKLRELKYISVDPEFKIPAKEIKSIKVNSDKEILENYNKDNLDIKEILKHQLVLGETIVEKIEAARRLKHEYLEEIGAVDTAGQDIISVLKEIILNNESYGISIAAVESLASYSRNSKLKEDAYKSLKSIFENGNQYPAEKVKRVGRDSNKITGGEGDQGKANSKQQREREQQHNHHQQPFKKIDSRIRSAIVNAIGQFREKKELLPNLLRLLQDSDEGYFLRRNAATAIGTISSSRGLLTHDEKRQKIEALKSVITHEIGYSESLGEGERKEQRFPTFQNLVARGAINGLRQFSQDVSQDLVNDIAEFMVDLSRLGKDYLIRLDATLALGRFLRHKISENDQIIDIRFNPDVFDQLKRILRSGRWGLQNAACEALVIDRVEKPDSHLIETIDELVWIAERDPDGWVRREAEISINNIRKWMRDWLKQPPQIQYKIRDDANKLQEQAVEVRHRHLVNLY